MAESPKARGTRTGFTTGACAAAAAKAATRLLVRGEPLHQIATTLPNKQVVTFGKLDALQPGQEANFTIETKAVKAGDVRCRVRLSRAAAGSRATKRRRCTRAGSRAARR